MPKGWAAWRVEFEQADRGPWPVTIRYYVRALSEADARYVATKPCKRNGGAPRVPEGVEFTVSKESS